MTADLTRALAPVQRRLSWGRAARLLLLGLGVGLALQAGQGALHAVLPGWDAGRAGAVSLLGGGGALLFAARRRPGVTPVTAARWADAALGLDGLLLSACTTPRPAPGLAGLMWGRMTRRADDEARALQDPHRWPRWMPGREVWLPLALLTLANASWLLPTVSLPGAAETVPPAGRAAPVAGTQAAPARARPGAGAAATPEERVRPPGAAGQAGSAGTASVPGGPYRPAGPVTVTGTGRAAAGSAARAGTPSREARSALVREASGTAGAAPAGRAGTVGSTPFGSREGGSFSNEQTPENRNALAAAPYDPGSKGSGTVRQKSSGPTGLRQASGGRGVESDGQDRCVQGCLTNADMNRGQQTRPRPRAPGGSTRSGTSDSGGSAAGNSSSVGLGVAGPGRVTVRTRPLALPGTAGASGDGRVQVYAVPDPSPAPPESGAADTGGASVRQPEPLLSRPAVPGRAQEAVAAYFRREP